jgi:prephenate dehydrogenase
MEPFISNTTIVTDTCSTKSNIVQYIKSHTPNLNFIGGHPMAGSEKSGYSASNDHLFENAYYVITPLQNEDTSHNILGDNKVKYMKEIIESLGAIPIVISPEKHDFAAAAVSHVPHILAFSLVNMVKELDDHLDAENLYMHTLAAGGFKDLTRIASSDAVMWENICKTNSENITKIVDSFCDNLKGITKKIENGESVEMIKYFNKARLQGGGIYLTLCLQI